MLSECKTKLQLTRGRGHLKPETHVATKVCEEGSVGWRAETYL